MREQNLYHHPPALPLTPFTAQLLPHWSLSLSFVVKGIPFTECEPRIGSVGAIPLYPDILIIGN